MNFTGARAGGPVDSCPTGTGDFSDLLRLAGAQAFSAETMRAAGGPTTVTDTQATTVLAFQYKDGVIIAGDRRATAGNIIMYDRADKVIDLDQDTIIAIAGSPAVAFEMARTLQT